MFDNPDFQALYPTYKHDDDA